VDHSLNWRPSIDATAQSPATPAWERFQSVEPDGLDAVAIVRARLNDFVAARTLRPGMTGSGRICRRGLGFGLDGTKNGDCARSHL
jgi:hypothetical protein